MKKEAERVAFERGKEAALQELTPRASRAGASCKAAGAAAKKGQQKGAQERGLAQGRQNCRAA
eukprot:10025717-Lingulodinium_polyedra.AAC.1